MFQRFMDAYRIDPEQQPGAAWDEPRLLQADGYRELAAQIAGCALESGLYRFHDASSGPAAAGLVQAAFPEFAARACPFGYDWLGNQFALDGARAVDGQAQVLILVIGTGEALEVPLTFADFHAHELVDDPEAALAVGFFQEWAAVQPTALPLAMNEVVGYRVPLSLGGDDTVHNLEVTDLDVYWTLSGQLRLATIQLPEGTTVSDIHGD